MLWTQFIKHSLSSDPSHSALYLTVVRLNLNLKLMSIGSGPANCTPPLFQVGKLPLAGRDWVSSGYVAKEYRLYIQTGPKQPVKGQSESGL